MQTSRLLNLTVVVAALGYFVDIYDLVLFSIVRVASLKSIGVPESDLLGVGVNLINMQMFGMLVGGIVWGIVGDKKGRLSVLFGSILLYSLANIANGFVTSVPMYALLRFIAGVGLAGELGAAITLVSEVMTKETRGYGTTIVAAVGVSGAVGAATVAKIFPWQTAYFIGGGLGLALLFLRLSLLESNMFSEVMKKEVRRGDIRMLFNNGKRFFKYLRCILIGVPIWFIIGVLVTFSPEIMKELGATGPVSAGEAIMYTYIGLIGGDLVSGLLSQFLRSRKKVVFGFLLLCTFTVWLDLSSYGLSPEAFYWLCLLMGFASGYWAVFVTIGSEQFGTNLRSTVTTTVPNFVRGAVVPLTLSFRALGSDGASLVKSATIIGIVCLVVAFLALFKMEDTYGKDLNYVEPT